MTELYSLKSTETYLSNGIYLAKEILEKYIKILVEYCIAISKQKFMITSRNTFSFVIIRGLDTITHVFKYVLLHTRNMEASYYHAERSIYYYLEFITQITEQKNAFLQLTSKDAVSYVYKKTIYQIISLSDSKQSNSDIINTINTNLQIYKNATEYAILNRKDNFNFFAEDVDNLKSTLIEIKTDKKKPSEWIKYFKEMNIILDDD